MKLLPVLLLAVAAALSTGCAGSDPSSAPTSSSSSSYKPAGETTTVTLPDGFEVTAELALTPEKQFQGLMYRPELPAGYGMLFVYPTMERRGFFMFQCVIALDIIWMDDNKRVVEISADTPPCRERDLRNCPTFGGAVEAVYILEISAGQAAAHNIKLGSELAF